MKTCLKLTVALAAFAALSSFALAQFEEESVRIIQTTEAKFPIELTNQGIREGEVRAMLLVDAEGKLEDCLITAYTHPEFAVELLSVVKSWEYLPAKVKGVPTGQRLQIVFHFNQRGALVSMLPAMAVAAQMNQMLPRKLTFLVRRADELDHVPAAIERISPAHPGKAMKPQERSGTASIDFFIDAQGHPRMPVVLRATREEFAAAAADALLQWRFEPPTCQGQPVAVRMVQEFIF
ncbi:MAG TPA: energy transducer TonB [Candidatus Limnocylindria bacterium]|nr:energy transducer TonB [Candidatus Limnocylindria bacterium]